MSGMLTRTTPIRPPFQIRCAFYLPGRDLLHRGLLAAQWQLRFFNTFHPRQDMDRLTEYANNGGIVVAMGQNWPQSGMRTCTYTPANGVSLPFMYQDVLGGNWLQESLTHDVLPHHPNCAR